MTRREFIEGTSLGGGLLAMSAAMGPNSAKADSPGRTGTLAAIHQGGGAPRPESLPDLTPARWVWYPSGRTLPNTFVLFRRDLRLAAQPRRATGWIAADSRYRLEVNGERVQWGPAPADPRWPEADPLDLTDRLRPGENVLGAVVLYYGHGDGTWPIGKPGFLFWLEIEHADGRVERVVSDPTWRARVCRAWPPGQFKRWYLRALQEEFDARLFPEGWSTSAHVPDADWLPAMPLEGSPNRPALSTNYYEYVLDVGAGPAGTELRPRSIPMMRESWVAAVRLSEAFDVEWRRPPREYFEFRVPEAFVATPALSTKLGPGSAWELALDGDRGLLLTFELAEQVVGWPGVVVEAPAGTTVELLVHEAHRPGGPPLLNTHFDSWTRFVCREGVNRFETFDFESLRWLQLHLHGGRGTVVVREVGVRRRVYPWPNTPEIRTSEPALQRLFDASLNTLNNCAQETLVDGMARERQQYSGDGGHQLHAVHLAFGETRLPARYLTTWSQGMTKDGYFLDCWPAFDRLARLVERQLDLSGWGPILDHGVGFNFDCWHHYRYTGDAEAVREPFPRLLRFADYLRGLVGRDGLLPVEGLGIPSVWIDHVAYRRQRDKQCAFNLYAAAMLREALAPLCRVLADERSAEAAERFGRALWRAVVKAFWSRERRLFVVNRPWLGEDETPRLCDRSLATAVLYDLCPGGRADRAAEVLAECPPEMGFSYPCNAGWRLWALAKVGRADVIVQDLRRRWATMDSVRLNNTLQEDWNSLPDSGAQWSHCAVAPLYIAYHGLAGIQPLEPGFGRFEVRPQWADLEDLRLTAWTVKGPIRLAALGKPPRRALTLEWPATCRGELVLPADERVDLPAASGVVSPGWRRYRLPGNGRFERVLER